MSCVDHVPFQCNTQDLGGFRIPSHHAPIAWVSCSWKLSSVYRHVHISPEHTGPPLAPQGPRFRFAPRIAANTEDGQSTTGEAVVGVMEMTEQSL